MQPNEFIKGFVLLAAAFCVQRSYSMSTDSEAKIAQVLSDIETAKRRATMALKMSREALRLSLSTPRIGAMLKEIEKELSESGTD
jgi:hypothetical protein